MDVEKTKGTWSTFKLLIGIFSLIFFIIVIVQSCAAGLGNALENNDSASGSQGFFCALFMLAAGITTIIVHNKGTKAPNIVAAVLFFIAGLFTVGSGDTFPDLPIWGSISFCFGLIMLGSLLVNSKPFENKRNLFIIILAIICIVVLVFGFTSIGSSEDSNKSESSGKSKKTEKKTTFKLGEAFTFDDLTITVGKDYSFTKIDNEFADEYGKTIVKLPVSVKNEKDETNGLSMFDYKFFGPNGNELSGVGTYFEKDAVDEAGDLQSGSSYTKYFYFVFDGNGKYSIEFEGIIEKKKVEFELKK